MRADCLMKACHQARDSRAIRRARHYRPMERIHARVRERCVAIFRDSRAASVKKGKDKPAVGNMEEGESVGRCYTGRQRRNATRHVGIATTPRRYGAMPEVVAITIRCRSGKRLSFVQGELVTPSSRHACQRRRYFSVETPSPGASSICHGRNHAVRYTLCRQSRAVFPVRHGRFFQNGGAVICAILCYSSHAASHGSKDATL